MALDIKKRVDALRNKKRSGRSHWQAVPFKASKGNKFVLFIGDEGAILIHIAGRTVKSRQFVPDTSLQSLSELRQTLGRDPDAPLTLIVDTMDQTYVPQTLPPVSSLSVGKLVKKRLERDFASTDIKGAILLGREKSGRRDWNYMMIALEKSPQLSAWLQFAEELPNHFRGIYLVSVETENLIRYMEHHLGAAGGGGKWKFFVSHNKVGGFRQVILHNGHIIFTRLAQPIGESSTEMVAGNIEQEMLSTIEYMKRLSFNPQDGLDIYIIASSGIKSVIDRSKFQAHSFHVFTPYELAQQLGIEGGTQPTDQFGDVVLAAAIGCSRRHVLTFSTPIARRVNQYYQLIPLQRAAAGLAALGILGYAGSMGVGIFSLGQDIEEMQASAQTQRSRIAALRAEVSKSNLDIDKANDLLELYQQLLKESASPIPLVQTLAGLKKDPVWITGITWHVGEEKNATGESLLAAAPDKQRMLSTLKLEFPDVTANPAGFRLVSDKVLSDVSGWLDGYEVKYISLPAGYQENSSLEIDFNNPNQKINQLEAAGPPQAELSIEGPVLSQPPAPKETASAQQAGKP